MLRNLTQIVIKTLLVAVTVLSLPVIAKEDESYVVGAEIHTAASLPFIRHDSYLAMNIPFAPVYDLRQAIEANTGDPLLGFEEAHVTVVTPLEYRVLKPFLNIRAIHRLAEKHPIQSAHASFACVGRGELTTPKGTMRTYFIVVDAEELFAIRREIAQAFVVAGGQADAFDPNNFYPHVTIGFTTRDLHIADGVIKDRRSCFADLDVKNDPVR